MSAATLPTFRKLAEALVNQACSEDLASFLQMAAPSTPVSKWQRARSTVLQWVFEFLPMRAQLRAQNVCKLWRQVSLDCGIFHLSIREPRVIDVFRSETVRLPHWRNLISLHVSSLAADSLDAIVNAVRPPPLRHLRLDKCRLPASVTNIASSLVVLDIRDGPAEDLLHLPSLPKLHQLSLSTSKLTSRHWSNVQLISHLSSLRKLSIRSTLSDNMPPDAFAFVRFAPLEELDLRIPNSGNQTMLAGLPECPALFSFACILPHGERFEAKHADELLKVKTLRELDLNGHIHFSGLLALCAKAQLSKLTLRGRFMGSQLDQAHIDKFRQSTTRPAIVLTDLRVNKNVVRVFDGLPSVDCPVIAAFKETREYEPAKVVVLNVVADAAHWEKKFKVFDVCRSFVWTF